MTFYVTVEEDKHSLYIKFNGFIYRPIGTKNYPDIETKFKQGDKIEGTVSVNHGDERIALWEYDERESFSWLTEEWYNHGWYLKIMKKRQRIVTRPIEKCWSPTAWWERLLYRANNTMPR